MGASSNSVKAGGASVSITADIAPFGKQLSAGEKRMKAFGSAALSIGTKVGAFGFGLGAGLLAAAKSFASAGTQMDDLSGRTGDTVENLSAMKFAAEKVGASLEDLQGGLTDMQGNLGKANRGDLEMNKNLSRLGLTAQALKGKLPTEQLAMLADGLSKVTDQSSKTDIAKAIFGGSGVKLLPLLDQGSAGIAKFRAEAERLGLVMSSEDAAAAAKLDDSFGSLSGTLTGVVNKVGGALAPALTSIVDYLTESAAAVGKFIGQNKALVSGMAVGVALIIAAGVAIGGIGVVSYAAGAAIGLLTSGFGLSAIASGIASAASFAYSAALAAMSAVSSVATGITAGLGAAVAFLASPFGIAVVAIGALVVAAVSVTTSMAQMKSGAMSAFNSIIAGAQGVLSSSLSLFSQLSDTAVSTFGGISDAIAAGNIQLAVDILWAGVKVAWLQGTAGLQAIWDGAMVYIEGAMDTTTHALGNLWTGLKGIFTAVIVNMEGAWDTLGTNLSSMWTKILTGIKGALDVFVTAISTALLDVMAGIQKGMVALNVLKSKAEKQKEYARINKETKDAKDTLNSDFAARADQRQKDLDNANDFSGLEKRRQERDARIEAAVDTSAADAAFKKRQKDRQARLDGANGEPSAELLNAQAGLQSLLQQAKTANAPKAKATEEGKKAVQNAQEIGGQMKGAEAQARGSSGAASSIAKSFNAQSNVPQQQLSIAKQQLEVAQKDSKNIETIAKQPPVKIEEHS